MMNTDCYLQRLICICASGWLFSSASAFGCLWEYGTSLSGRSVQVEGSFDGHSSENLLRYSAPLVKARQDSRLTWQQRERELSESLKTASNYKTRSDFAVSLVHLGKHEEALKIFKEIEISNPGTYINAANLGTTYELVGDLPEALSWIKEGINRNPQAHAGTEWLHVKILEARVALKCSGRYLI